MTTSAELTICYQCERQTVYLFADSRCCNCTRLTIAEVTGEGQINGDDE